MNSYLPRMVCRSLASTGTAVTRIRTSPGPGCGIGRVCRCRTSDGSPIVSATTARMVVIFLTLLRSDPDLTWFRVHSVGRDDVGNAASNCGERT